MNSSSKQKDISTRTRSKPLPPAPAQNSWPELANVFSLIPLDGKVPVEKGWEQWCRKKRSYKAADFKSRNAGIACGEASGVLVLDVDNRQKFKAQKDANGWELPDTYKVKTGPGRAHYYFIYPNDGKHYGNKSIKAFGFDIRGDGGQVVAENSIHPDTDEQYKRMGRSLPPQNMAPAPEWLLALYDEKPKEKAKNGVDWTGGIDALNVSQRIKSLIIENIPVGKRSEAEITVLNALVEAGVSDKGIEDIFDQHPIGDRAREKGGEHLQNQIDNARKYTEPQENKRQDKHIDLLRRLACTSDEFIARKDIKPPPRLITPLIREQSLSMIYAPAGAGKTWFVLSIALALTRKNCTEIEIGPWQVKRGCGVLLFDGEMAAGDLKERIQQLGTPMGPGNPDRPLTIITAEEIATEGDVQVNLNRQGWRDDITALLKEREEIKLLILDNISSLAPGGDENAKASWDPINQWLLALRRQGVAVILVHHAGKGGDYRGHSGRIDNLDNVIELKAKAGAEGACFEVRYTKHRALKPGQGKPFCLQLEEVAPGSLVLKEHAGGKDRKQQIEADLLRGRPRKDMESEYGIKPARLSQYAKVLKDAGLLDSKGNITRKGKNHLTQLEESMGPGGEE